MRKVLFILGELEDSDLQWLLGAGKRNRVSSDSSIIVEGEKVDTLFIVVGGTLSVSIGGSEVARLGAGEIVGDMALLDSRPASATVKAVEDSAVFAVAHAVLRAKLRSDTAFAARFYRSLCIFLANRLSRTSAMMGSGGEDLPEERPAQDDEISPDVLEKVSLAGARFDWFLKQLREN